MNTKIKKYADSGDIKSLKYIFVDSLDVDPTFVRYEEEYNYCKSIPGLIENHIELTPFKLNRSEWNEEYWSSLKMDLIKNFSDKRMCHMREVAQVFLSDKVQRILVERASLSKMEEAHHCRQGQFYEAKQSSEAEDESPTVLQKNLRESLIKNAFVNEKTDDRRREKGNTRYQIFSNDKFIFSVSSTFEKLYRYRVDTFNNEVVEIVVFKRTRIDEFQMMFLQSMIHVKNYGVAMPFNNTQYDVYALKFNQHLRGYVLYPREIHGIKRTISSEKMYYLFEEYEKKYKY